jgi:hypothetical protein
MSLETANSFEEVNAEAYRLLLRIEVSLREIVKTALKEEHGVQWQKKLSGDLLKKIKDAQTEERKPQFNYARLGPLYYLTFGELITQLGQKPCSKIRQKLGGDVMLKQLENIYGPRNAVCHSRPVSTIGMASIQNVYVQIENAIHPERIESLIANPDTGMDRHQAVILILSFMKLALCELASLPKRIEIPDDIKVATFQYWWADSDLAGFDTVSIERIVAAIELYNIVPKGVGAAGQRQRILEEAELLPNIEKCVLNLEKAKL